MKKPTLPTVQDIRKWPLKSLRFLVDNWWPILSILPILSVTGTLLGIKLLGLTNHHLSAAEQVYHSHIVNNDFGLRDILKNPVNLPFNIGIYLLEKLHLSDALFIRALGSFFGAISIGAFFLLLKSWHTRRVAILGTILFATSAWTLHTSRYGSPEVLLMSSPILLLCATWLKTSTKRRTALTLCLIATLAFVYVPGMIVFVVAGIAWQAKRIYKELRKTPLTFVIPWLLLGLLLLTPLLWAALRAPHNLLAILGLPNKFPGLREFGKNLAYIPVQLTARGPLDPAKWLGRLPILDVFSIIMSIIGIYAYAFRFSLDRTKLLLGIFLVGSLLIAIGGGTLVTISFLMPFVFILVAGGITLMIQQWSTVFPRNPFAKTLATTLMSIVVALVAFYNFNHYFIAWPNTPETRSAFFEK